MPARLVILLGNEFGVDPFAEEDTSIADVRTVDQLVRVYTSVTAQGAPA
ncbi:hypothetical protein ABZY93_25610 [Streptomyces smyrnaeus]